MFEPRYAVQIGYTRQRAWGRIHAKAQKPPPYATVIAARYFGQSVTQVGMIPNANTGQPPLRPAFNRYTSLPHHVVLAPYLASSCSLRFFSPSCSDCPRVTRTPASMAPLIKKALKAYRSRSNV